jgi:hypothetical protein
MTVPEEKSRIIFRIGTWSSRPMNVTLRPELERLIEAEVKSGRSPDSS